MKEEINKEFGEVEVRTCSFCNKVYKTDKFYSIPCSDDSLIMKAMGNMVLGRKKHEEINDGICLKCILKGLLKICNNNKEKVNEYVSLYLKEAIIDNLKTK